MKPQPERASYVRLAYICKNPKCVPPFRKFMRPGDAPPSCPDGHGLMQMQENRPYKGTKP